VILIYVIIYSNIVKFYTELSKQEWNSRESSWDFLQNELVRLTGEKKTLQSAIETYKTYWSMQFHQLHQNEVELNRQFIEIYGLQNDLDPHVHLLDFINLTDE